ncbi:MAG: RluA family pseudouridine synthase [Myxococcota bacterium]
MSEAIRFVVEAENAKERLDRFLSQKSSFTRSALQRWISEGRVAIDGVEVRVTRTRIAEGQTIVLTPAPPPPSDAIPEDLPVSILHQDEHLLVVNKAPGMVVHPAPGHPTGTLVNALLFHTTFSDRGDPMRPGIVHRLDKDTSGVMVVARTVAAREGLVALFQAHTIERRYDAIAIGNPPEQATHDTLHGRHPVHRKRFTSRLARGKRAVTHVRVQERLHGAALVACTLETGRTHQIRVHLADAGTPVLGDPYYAKAPKDERLRAAHEDLGRQALHAALLGFVHPVTKESMRFEAEPPPDFQRALATLRA